MCDGPRLATVPEVAAQWQMRPGTLRDLIRRRGLPIYRIGRAVRVDPNELLALLRVEGNP
jgi:excisionase family DNA binding protein